MRQVLLVLGSLALTAVLVPGCGGSSDGSGTAAPIPKEQLLDRMTSAVCDNIGPCCSQQGYAHDPASCKQLLTQFYGQFVTPLLSADGVQYDAAAAGACLKAFQSVAASCAGEPDSPACDRVFVGTLAEGANCQLDEQCKAPPGGSAYCDDGKCVAEPRGKLGDGCYGTCTTSGNSTSCSGGGGASNGNATCYTNDGVFCGESGNCEQLAGAGQSCGGGGCVAGHYCGNGTCTPQLGAGGDCGGSWEACNAQTYCNDVGKCAERQQNGADCQSAEECQSDYCDYAGGGNAGKCAPDYFVTETICSGQPSP